MTSVQNQWWRRAETWTPECLLRFIQRALDSMLHAAAIALGGVYMALSSWDVVIAGHAFAHLSFASGAVEIMGAWGTLWQVNRYLKRKWPLPDDKQGG